jgi:hypothetical protein
VVGACIDEKHSSSTIVRAGAVRFVLRDEVAVGKGDKEDNLGHNDRKAACYMDMWVQV